MSAEDAARLGCAMAMPILLAQRHGELRGRVKIDRIKPGCLQAHWPEANVLIPAGRLDASGVPDYNATVEVVSPLPLRRCLLKQSPAFCRGLCFTLEIQAMP